MEPHGRIRKERRQFLSRLGGLSALLALAVTGRNRPVYGAVADASGGLGGGFVHSVYFWLVDESLATRERFVAELHRFIDHVDVIRSMHVGSPADTRREVVDHTYSYCLIVTFDSKADHDVYQEHPFHKQFIENASSLWSRVQVYDSVTAW